MRILDAGREQFVVREYYTAVLRIAPVIGAASSQLQYRVLAAGAARLRNSSSRGFRGGPRPFPWVAHPGSEACG